MEGTTLRQPLVGAPAPALGVVRQVLVTQGFRIVEERDGRLVADGPGVLSSHESPLRSAARVELRAAGGALEMVVDLGALGRLMRWTALALVALGGLLLGLFAILMPGNPVAMWATIGALAPWVVLLPWMSGLLRRRAAREFATLLHNAAYASRAAQTPER